jgi:hypothetical protein
MWGPHACAVMPWGGDCTLGLAWEVAIMMPLQHYVPAIFVPVSCTVNNHFDWTHMGAALVEIFKCNALAKISKCLGSVYLHFLS